MLTSKALIGCFVGSRRLWSVRLTVAHATAEEWRSGVGKAERTSENK
jgi:hypothetical protein